MFRLLLRLLPRDVRERWGWEMEALLRRRLEDADSAAARLRIRAGASWDLVRHVVVEALRRPGDAAAVLREE